MLLVAARSLMLTAGLLILLACGGVMYLFVRTTQGMMATVQQMMAEAQEAQAAGLEYVVLHTLAVKREREATRYTPEKMDPRVRAFLGF